MISTQFFGEKNLKTANLYPVKSKQRLQIKIISILCNVSWSKKKKKEAIGKTSQFIL